MERKENTNIVSYVGIVTFSIVSMATLSIDIVVEQQEVGPFFFYTGNFV